MLRASFLFEFEIKRMARPGSGGVVFSLPNVLDLEHVRLEEQVLGRCFHCLQRSTKVNYLISYFAFFFLINCGRLLVIICRKLSPT